MSSSNLCPKNEAVVAGDHHESPSKAETRYVLCLLQLLLRANPCFALDCQELGLSVLELLL